MGSVAARPERARGRRWGRSVLWFGVLVGAGALMLVARGCLDKAHVALVFLLVVPGGSPAGGRALGISLAFAAFFAFNYFFLPPHLTLVIETPPEAAR